MRIYHAGHLPWMQLTQRNAAACKHIFAAPSNAKYDLSAVRAAGASIIMDSGAYTLMSSQQAGLDRKLRSRVKLNQTPSQFMANYVSLIDEQKDHLDYFVELDVGELLGQETVYKWRKVWERRGLIEKMIPGHHPSVESYAEWKARMLDMPSRYVAIQGYFGGKPTIDYMPYIDECYNAACKIHGFAMTKRAVLFQLPFYSVDSASVVIYNAMGRIVTSRAGPVKSDWIHPHRDAARKALVKLDAPLAPVLDFLSHKNLEHARSSRLALNEHDLLEFQKVESTVTALWKRRGYDWEAVTGANTSNNRTAETEGT